MKKRTALPILALSLLLILIWKYTDLENSGIEKASEMPILSAVLKEKDVFTTSVIFEWTLTNVGDIDAFFENNNVMMVKLNGHDQVFDIPQLTLSSGETFCFEFTLQNVNLSKGNIVSVTALSKEGTQVTIEKQIEPSE